MEKYKILDVQWRSALHTIGFVAYDTGFEGEWNSVVGYVPDKYQIFYDDENDIKRNISFSVAKGTDETVQYIAAHGAKIEWKIAQILFPNLDIKLHKYYGKNVS